jgi:hypothetical protein
MFIYSFKIPGGSKTIYNSYFSVRLLLSTAEKLPIRCLILDLVFSDILTNDVYWLGSNKTRL